MTTPLEIDFAAIVTADEMADARAWREGGLYAIIEISA